MKKIGLGHYLKKHLKVIILYVVIVFLATGLWTATALIFANSLTSATAGDYAQTIKLLLYVLCVVVLNRFCWLSTNLIYFKYSGIIMSEISVDLTKRSFQLSSSTFSENNSGTFLQRIMDDPARAVDLLATILDIVADIISAVVVVVYVITLNWIIGLIYLFAIVGLSILEMFRLKIRKKGRTEVRKVNDETYSIMGEIIKSEKDIKALNLDEKLYELTDQQINKKRKLQLKVAKRDTVMAQTRNLLLNLFSVGILILGIIMMEKSLLSIAVYVLLFSYKDNLYGLIWGAGNLAQCFTDISISTNRMFSLFNEDLFPTDKFGTVVLNKPKGKIQFKNVSFAYTEIKEKTKDNKKKRKSKQLEVPEHIKKDPIFKNLSFTIKPNTTVAFVGRSGSGKSTILSLIAKLIETDSGEVLIDGKDIKTLTKESIRNNVSLINQFPYIFDMTIKENLLLVKKDATDEEIWDALKRASFDEDVKSMPNGLDTRVGETGIKLSGGQRQRLAIARALLKESKIIIFDESTSSLDNFAQSHIQKSIENLKGQHTIVIVAHRLSTIKNVDTIYFLQQGKIVDQGSFNELFNNNKEFQDMFLIENI